MSYPSCAGALMWSLASVVLTALDPCEQLVDATLAICLVRNGVEGQAAGTEPGNEQVEVEAADQLQTLEVVAAIAGPVEQHHPPVAASEHDRVAREQAAMLTARPQVRGRAARVPGGGDHLEVGLERAGAVDEHVAALSLQQEGATLERGAKRHRLQSRRVQAFNYRLRGRSSSQ